MIKAFHISDLHLDAEFSYLDKTKSNVRKNEIRMSFLSQVENAYDKGARVFLIPGDIFDSKPFCAESLSFLKSTFERFSDSEFFLSFGNHDYIYDDEFKQLKEYFGQNVFMFNDTIDMYEFDDYRVYGVSFSDSLQRDSLLEGFCAIKDDKINIMVLHGEIVSEGRYNPVKGHMIEDSGLDYLALGHVHIYSGMNKAGDTYYCYSGTHEGKGFDELDDKGGVYLEIDKGALRYEFIPLSIRKHREIIIDAGDFDNSSLLLQSIISKMDNPSDLYKIILVGEIEEELSLNTDTLLKALDGYAFFVKVYDETALKINMDKYADDNTLTGGFIREIKMRIEADKSNEEYWNKVLRKGMELLK